MSSVNKEQVGGRVGGGGRLIEDDGTCYCRGGGGGVYLRGWQGNFDLVKMMVSILHTN